MAGVRDVRSKSGGTVRIISGEWRSRKIEVPSEDRTRPMLDRVKAAVFDTLGSWYGTPGRLPPIVVADVFAGGGTLGLEALSRGARTGVFFENNGAVLDVLRRNLAKLGVGARGAVEAVDAWSARLADILLQYRCTLVFLDLESLHKRSFPSGQYEMRESSLTKVGRLRHGLGFPVQ